MQCCAKTVRINEDPATVRSLGSSETCVRRAGEFPPDFCAQELVRPPSRVEVGGHFLLTGATGFLGAHILRALLLKGKPDKITCLVRCKDGQTPKERLAKVLEWYFGTLPTGFAQCVEVIPCDLAQRGLGMSKDGWLASAAADQILHVAADVRHGGEASETFRVNYQATIELLGLAAERVPARFHHVSTIAVKGVGACENRQSFSEDDLDIGQGFADAYSESKFMAEVAVRSYALRGGITTVYRVGTIGPQWDTGRFQQHIGDHFFTRFLRSTVLLGIAADWPGLTFGLNPVDHLADAIITLVMENPVASGTLHLDTPYRFTHYDLIRLLHVCGYAIRVVPTETFEHCVLLFMERLSEVEAEGVLPLLKTSRDRILRLETSRSLAKLAAFGFTFQRMDELRFVRFLNHLVEREYLPPPLHHGIILETAPVWSLPYSSSH